MQHEDLSPEVIRAQRMAELEQMAKYRYAKMEAYRDWADPVKRAAMKMRAEAEALAARNKMAGKLVDDYRVRPKDAWMLDDWHHKVLITPITKPVIKTRWYQFILDWFK